MVKSHAHSHPSIHSLTHFQQKIHFVRNKTSHKHSATLTHAQKHSLAHILQINPKHLWNVTTWRCYATKWRQFIHKLWKNGKLSAFFLVLFSHLTDMAYLCDACSRQYGMWNMCSCVCVSLCHTQLPTEQWTAALWSISIPRRSQILTQMSVISYVSP